MKPVEFEKQVEKWLRLSADSLDALEIQHLGLKKGHGGSYKFDVLVEFKALGGAAFTVLVECKHHRRRVERDQVQVLQMKALDTNAQKAMFFSTSGFQQGAIKFAEKYKIALIQVDDEQMSMLVEEEDSWEAGTPAGFKGTLIAPPQRYEQHALILDFHISPLRRWLGG